MKLRAMPVTFVPRKLSLARIFRKAEPFIFPDVPSIEFLTVQIRWFHRVFITKNNMPNAFPCQRFAYGRPQATCASTHNGQIGQYVLGKAEDL